jgi:hypothetical protein
MSRLAEFPDMATPKGRPKRSERDDVSVKIDRGIARMAKAIADKEGSSVAEVLSESARETVGKRYAKMLRDLEGPA